MIVSLESFGDHVLGVLSLKCWDAKWWLENNFRVLTVQIEYVGTMCTRISLCIEAIFLLCVE